MTDEVPALEPRPGRALLDTTGRTPEVAYQAGLLRPNPNLPEHVRGIAGGAALLGDDWLRRMPDGPETVEALRLLRRAKDSAILSTLAPFEPGDR